MYHILQKTNTSFLVPLSATIENSQTVDWDARLADYKLCL